MKKIANVLTIAGVDPSGGAGIYADLKAFSALGTYGMGIVAALTAQSTRGVTGVEKVPVGFIREQMETLFADVRVDAAKVGMLGDVETIRVVAEGLRKFLPEGNVVVDPVMVAKGGHRLLQDAAVAALREVMVPLAGVLTPNVPEAEVLLGGRRISNVEEMKAAARELRKLGARVVVVKGGHLEGEESVDVVDDGKEQRLLSAKRVATKNTHGTGCTFSAALAALLGKGLSVMEAVEGAKEYITGAIGAAGNLEVGSGHGPVNHFYKLWK